jgi:DNA-binding FadR family transcriptional regulator
MRLTDDAIEKIKDMIVSGVLQPGSRLPKEDELARELGLSRSSLREAVRALSLVRILEVRRGDGTYVTSLSPEVLLEAVSFVVDVHRDDSVLHFLEVRRMLEPAATAMAARNIGEEGIEKLRAILAQVSAESNPSEIVQNDLEFHRAIVAGSNNPVLVSLLDSMSGPTNRARVWRGMTEENAHARTLREHNAIIEALARHDAEIAAARCLVHIAGLEEWLRRAVETGDEDGDSAAK